MFFLRTMVKQKTNLAAKVKEEPLPSKIYGLILVPEAVLTCDKELFP